MCSKWFRSPCVHRSHARQLGSIYAQGRVNNFPFPTLVLTVSQGHLNHPVFFKATVRELEM